LDAPGAGLPRLENSVLNAAFKLSAMVASSRRALTKFRRETNTILEIVNELNVNVVSQQYLIPRVIGIEDSSRNWSVLMVLEHLSVVNQGIMEIIQQLCEMDSAAGATNENSTVNLVKVEIADFKPNPDVDESVIVRYRSTAAMYGNAIETIFADPQQTLKTDMRHLHPWFGKLSAHQWHCLAAAHQQIHRRQIRKILAMVGVT
jgi:hypothetical protein